MRPNRPKTRALAAVPLLAALLFLALARSGGPGGAARADEPSPRVRVPKDRIRFDDGDTFVIRWPAPRPAETIRILGIDTPEVRHLEHDLPYDQPFGREAAGFLRGCLAVADRVELLRAAEKDPFGRTLAYVYLDGKSYAVLVLDARLAVENVSHFGDNGLPAPAAEVLAAAKRAGPVPFGAPYRFRRRMRAVAAWMKAHGAYPAGRAAAKEKQPGPNAPGK